MFKWLLISFSCYFNLSWAQTVETLTIYAPSAFSAAWGPGPIIRQAFEAQYHCRVRWVVFNGGRAILNRLHWEGQHSRADVILGLDNSLLPVAHESGLFAPHQLDQQSLTLPGGWDDRYFLPYDYSYLTFIYHQQRVMQPPRSLQALVEGPEQWRVIYADPRSSSLGFQFLQWMNAQYGSTVAAAWRQLAHKTVTVTKDWSEAYGLFLKGEADFVLGYNTSLAYHQHTQPQHPYRALQFSAGQPIQVEIAAIVARSRHAALAKHFLQFLISPTVQTLLPPLHWVYPVIEVPLPPAFLPLEPLSGSLKFSEVNALQRKQWIQTWRQAAVKG